MDKIKIAITGRVASVVALPEVVADNAEYEVDFALDPREGWDMALPITALFVRRDGSYTARILDAGETSCTMPPQTGTNIVYVGLTQDDMRTTTPATIKVRRSIRTVANDPLPAPTEDVYAQILAAYAGIKILSGKGAPTSATQGKVNQLYRDEDTQKLYICTATDGGYTWAAVSGGSVDVDATLTKAGYAADAKAAGDAIGKKIDAPQVAQVGEVLTVEEVDAEGKPKKWKTAPGVDITTELTQESTDAQVPSAKAAYDAMQDATDKEAVRFVAQELTDTQKQQARVNIGTYEWRYCISKSELTQKLNSWGDVGSINRHYSVPEDEFGDINLPALALSNGYMHGVNVYTIFDSVGKVWELVTGNSNSIKRRYNDIMVVTIKADDNGNLLGDIDPWTINWSATEDKMAIFANYQGCVFPLKSCTNKYAIFSATLENDAGEFVIRHVSVDANQLVKVYDIPVAPDTIPRPATAQVGQIVKVKAVDADGKITETEAVDMPISKSMKWITVHSSTLAKETTKIVVSADPTGKAIADYNPVGLTLIISTPADATQTDDNGSPWVYPSATKEDNAIRAIGSIAIWKTVARDNVFAFYGGSSAMTCTGNINVQLATYTIDGYALDGVTAMLNGNTNHFPVGTHVEVAILCEVPATNVMPA